MTAQATNDTTAQDVGLAPPEVAIPRDVLQTAERLGIASELPQVIAISRELFGDPIALHVAEDPELDQWTHIIVQAVPQGTVEETVAKEERWCDRMVENRLSRWFTLMDD
jgi:hypothetical protein